jgi:hypothetical protein
MSRGRDVTILGAASRHHPWEKTMKKIFAAALFAATVAGFGAANAAMPMAPMSAADTAEVIQVAQGCGPGYARGPRGFCRPMRMGPPPGRFCPPGMFRNPYGRCIRRW